MSQACRISPAVSASQEERSSESEAERRRRLYETILSNTPDFIYAFDLKHRFIYANDALLKMWGRTWDEAIGKTCLELGYEPWHAAMHDREIEQVVATKNSIRGEVLFTGTVGTHIYDYIFAPVLDADGQVEGIAGTMRNVTDRKQAEEKLKTSEHWMRHLIEAIPTAIYATDAEGRIRMFNREALKFSGRTPVLGEDSRRIAEKLYWPDGTPLAYDQCPPANSLRERRALHGHEAIAECTDGRRIRFLSHPTPLFDVTGKLMGAVDLLPDITDRKIAEQNNARLAAIVESSDDAIIGKDLDGIITSWNPSAERLFGHTAREAIGKPITILIPPERSGEEPDLIGAVRRGERIEQFETVRCRKDNSRVNVFLTLSPIRNAKGEIVGVSKIVRDITERKRANEELRQSDQRFRMLFDSMDEGFCVIEVIFDEEKRPVDYRFLDVNPAFERQTGIPNARGKLMRELLPAEEGRWLNIYGEIALTGETRRFENRALALDRWCDVCAFRIGAPERHHVGIVFNDITERKRISEERQAMLDSERSARSVAEHAGRMKDEFLATLSHELRTPLNAILGYATIMRTAKLDDRKTKEAVETIERNARIQAQLIQDLLDMNGIISGKVRLDMQRINIIDVIEEAVKAIQPSAEAKNISLNIRLKSRAIPVRADPNRIQQIIGNLLSNAIKFTPLGGKVEISLGELNSYVALTINDNGSGIYPEFLPYVFDRFRQADGSITRPHGGLGLGLAIAKQLVELHGGTIRAESEGKDKGATFIVQLPILTAVRSDRRDKGARFPDSAPNNETNLLKIEEFVDLSGVRVLVVDDEADATRLVKLVLQDCRAVVIEAASAQQAFDLLSQAQFNVLVSDIGMPGEDGYQLIRRVRAMPHANRNIPAIAMTAFARSEDRRRAAFAGFQTHMVKPIEAPELVAHVANLSGRIISGTGRNIN